MVIFTQTYAQTHLQRSYTRTTVLLKREKIEQAWVATSTEDTVHGMCI